MIANTLLALALTLGFTFSALAQTTITIDGKTITTTSKNVTIVNGTVVSESENGSTTKEAGMATEETRELPTFDRITLSMHARVTATISERNSVSPRIVVNADSAIIPLIKTVVTNGNLLIYPERSYSTSIPVSISIDAPPIRGAELQGSGSLSVDNVSGDRLQLETQGSGDISVTGEVKMLTAGVNGSGNLRLAGLRSTDARVEINGSGDAEVQVTGRLVAEINGSGNISYSGKPEDLVSSVNGSGNVRRH